MDNQRSQGNPCSFYMKAFEGTEANGPVFQGSARGDKYPRSVEWLTLLYEALNNYGPDGLRLTARIYQKDDGSYSFMLNFKPLTEINSGGNTKVSQDVEAKANQFSGRGPSKSFNKRPNTNQGFRPDSRERSNNTTHFAPQRPKRNLQDFMSDNGENVEDDNPFV